ncbi:MAG: response regulator [Elusimicrobia bacterium]|nr:response regulator [Elusimicrobiota bacterium]
MKRLLLVDDDAAVRRMLGRLLSRDYQVVEAACREEALRSLAQGGLDGVFLDVRLSGESGWDLLEELRAGGSPPVVMMTGDLVYEAERGDARARGARDIVQKPFERVALLKLAADSFG